MVKRKRRRKVRERPKVKGSLGHWVEEIRAPFFTATIAPVLLGTTVAWASDGAFDLLLFILTMAGVLCLHAGTNIANDYFDHVSGNDEVNVEYIRPFSGGSRMIQRGLLEPGSVLRVALGFMAVGAALGLVILYLTKGMLILVFGLIGVFCGYFYTAPPFRLASRGLGELVVAINFGVLTTVGAYYVQTLTISLEVMVASLPIAFLIFLLLYVNEFPDYKADKEVGKDTLVVRLGRRRAVGGYSVLALLTYGVILGGIALEILPQVTLLALVTAPMAVISARALRVNFDRKEGLAPICGRTIALHFVTGILLIVAYVMDEVVLKGAEIL
jgi:1,4-dihydroxy-2-naphthoate octaprenyltransferase